MANTPTSATNSRAHYSGVNADTDIHIEAYEGTIETAFRYESLFRSSNLTNFKRIKNTNTWRGDRLGGAVVKGRSSGEALDSTRIVNEKMNVTVDRVSYIRTTTDDQDDWTSPDFMSDYGKEHGSAHGRAFDQAHLAMLLKAGSWVAPPALAATPGWYNGINATMTGYAALVATGSATDAKLAADMLVRQHKQFVATFTRRWMTGSASTSINRFVTLMAPEAFNILLEHDKLMNVQFQSGDIGTEASKNDFAKRRIAYLNGTPVIETPAFPMGATTNTVLGPAFNISAAEAKAQFILYNPEHTLVTVEVKPLTFQEFHVPQDYTRYLDSLTMYSVGLKRGDATAVAYSD